MSVLRRLKAALMNLIRYGCFFPATGLRICPFCNRWWRKFMPNTKNTPGQPTIDRYQIIAMGRREQYRCPGCNSTDKERLVFLYLKDKVRGGEHVLHIAPEKNLGKWLKDRTSYTAGDKFEGSERYLDGRYEGALNLDITDLSFTDSSFDLIVCNHVLEHVPADRVAMQELRRVLKPGGMAILQVPMSAVLHETVEGPVDDALISYGQSDHVRVYGKDYTDRLKDAGFLVEEISAKDVCNTELNGVNPHESVFVARKV